MNTIDILVILFLLAGMAGSYFSRKLTLAAAITGGIIAYLTFKAFGWSCVVMMVMFFVSGTLATSWKISEKIAFGVAETDKGRRKTGQVLANAGIPLLLSLLSFVFPYSKTCWLIMTACAFSSAIADTLSSELGSIYGKRFYNIITFRRDTRGLDGVVSIEGFLFGILGSLLISFVYVIFHGWNINFIIIIIAGTIGNVADSIMGATFERKGIIKNDVVNLINTVIASLTGAVLYFLI